MNPCILGGDTCELKVGGGGGVIARCERCGGRWEDFGCEEPAAARPWDEMLLKPRGKTVWGMGGGGAGISVSWKDPLINTGLAGQQVWLLASVASFPCFPNFRRPL